MTKVREPQSVVEIAERCVTAQQLLLERGLVKGDQLRLTKNILEALPTADFYEIDEAVGAATDQMFEAMFSGKNTETLVLDADCRLPSKVCGFWSKGSKVHFPEHEQPLPFLYLAVEEEKETLVFLVSPYFSALLQGGYRVGEEGAISAPVDGDDADKEVRVMHTLSVAAVCSILNQPSFTKREPAGSRQERRAANRTGGFAVDAWHRVTWNIGEEVKAKLTRDEPVRCMPLHYTRGHWRRGQEGWANAAQRKDGHWYQWIEGYWSGHPAFGVKKSYHAPKLEGHHVASL